MWSMQVNKYPIQITSIPEQTHDVTILLKSNGQIPQNEWYKFMAHIEEYFKTSSIPCEGIIADQTYKESK